MTLRFIPDRIQLGTGRSGHHSHALASSRPDMSALSKSQVPRSATLGREQRRTTEASEDAIRDATFDSGTPHDGDAGTFPRLSETLETRVIVVLELVSSLRASRLRSVHQAVISATLRVVRSA